MTEIEYRLADLINFSSNQKPLDFEAVFSSILQNKLEAAVDDRKLEIAQTMFRPSVEENSEEEYEHG
jgi:hypothetical protein